MDMSEKVKKPLYKKWWIWLIAIIVVFAIASGGDDESEAVDSEEATAVVESSESEDESENDDAKEEEEEETEEKTEFELGEKVELNDNIVEVVEVEKSTGDDFDKPKEGKEYVIVHVSIENNGDEDTSYNPYDFKMKNSNGQIEDPAFSIIDSDTALNSGELAPGGNVSGTMVFEQEIDDDQLQLIYEASFWSDKEIVFNL